MHIVNSFLETYMFVCFAVFCLSCMFVNVMSVIICLSVLPFSVWHVCFLIDFNYTCLCVLPFSVCHVCLLIDFKYTCLSCLYVCLFLSVMYVCLLCVCMSILSICFYLSVSISCVKYHACIVVEKHKNNSRGRESNPRNYICI